MIRSHGHVVSADGDDFCQKVEEVIRDFQDQGLKVDIQYRPTNGIYTAYITGSDKDVREV